MVRRSRGSRGGSSRPSLASVLSLFMLLVALGRLMFFLYRPPLKRSRSSRSSKETYGYTSTVDGEDLRRNTTGGDRASTSGRTGGWHSRSVEHAWENVGQGESSAGESLARGDEQMVRHVQPMAKWGSGKTVLIFTMDSLQDTIESAARGGPAGEIKIRESMMKGLTEAGVQVIVAASDGEFVKRARSIADYQGIVLDPWTWAEKGWKLKQQLRGCGKRIFIMDFFGSETPHQNLPVPTARFLTAFPTPAERAHTFLGYRMDFLDSMSWSDGRPKRQQGIIWGKTTSSFRGAATRRVVSRLAELVELHSTISPAEARKMHLPKSIVFHGILSKKEWQKLLRDSKFMIGLGHPLSGPSAVDAVASGCMYINPVYSKPQKIFYASQHPYLQQVVGEPYVCSYPQEDVEGALACARKALGQDLGPMELEDLSEKAYRRRVRDIFEPVLAR